ncbi:transposase [Desulfospira joergensenii]|uniref:transposase n=1 Tax=Desulfospira joergensenii TaxID=53329 RepID=UPI000A068682
MDNYLACCDRNLSPHFESLEATSKNDGRRRGIFLPSEFTYDTEKDRFICPNGKHLKLRKFKKKRNHFEYAISGKVCNKCNLKDQCTRSKFGRTLKRHVRQEDLDRKVTQSQSQTSKDDIGKRQHLMERSFARSVRYGYKRSRWRRLWRLKIQEYLTATIQNIMILVRNGRSKDRAVMGRSLEYYPNLVKMVEKV